MNRTSVAPKKMMNRMKENHLVIAHILVEMQIINVCKIRVSPRARGWESWVNDRDRDKDSINDEIMIRMSENSLKKILILGIRDRK